jgi:hypothetical protein
MRSLEEVSTMAEKAKPDRKTAAEKFGEMVRVFSNTVGEIMDDPELKRKAREFSQSALDAAVKVVESKVKEEEMRAKFRNVGKAAQNLGKKLEEDFKA